VSEQDLISPLQNKVLESELPIDLKERVSVRLEQMKALTNSPTFLPEIDKMTRYVDWITVLPWNKHTDDILDLNHAREIMDKSHYGLDELKERVLEYLAVMQLKGKSSQNIARAPILCFVGLVGTGKTTFAASLAEALGRKIARIPFGGMGSPLDLRGQSRAYPEAEPGRVIKALKDTQSKNCVILLDEIDRVTEEGRSSIMGVLVELLDPQQNHAFVDHYIDFPFDLSEVVFIATANNTTNIATAVMDRLEPIQMPSYTDQEKTTIAQKYIMPRALEEAGLNEDVIKVSDEVWHQFVRPLGYDAGIRTLERTVKAMVRKVAKEMVEGKGQRFDITPDNVKNYLPQW